VFAGLAASSSIPGAHAADKPARIVVSRDASWLETVAARELRRYVYLRTGELLPIRPADSLPSNAQSALVIGRKDRSLVRNLLTDPAAGASLAALPAQGFWLKTLPPGGRKLMVVTGGDELGTLYGAYRLAEHLGVRFYLHGDVLPDQRVGLTLPELDEIRAPLFTLRGTQPFHDFPEGPDWWNQDDYLAVLGQLPKLRMNFFGLHTYPEGSPNAEPTVWIGPPADVAEGGRVRFSYPSSYQNTLRGNWGYAARKTGDFSCGAADLFERDDFGAEVMWGHIPQPASPEGCNQVFERTAGVLREAFRQARRLGVKTCVGTETPLTVPQVVRERLQGQGKPAADLAVTRDLYEGIFRRIAASYPIDYYWFWTPEGWTWEGTKEDQMKRTLDDLSAAIDAHQKLRAPFGLATCGWVLGPQQDRALFDKVLPKTVAVSCINREVGRTPVDRGFANVSGRGKWAIPWLEDDPALTSPQLWAGRMRRDAADARRYGCDGLMGIHWRTRTLGPAVAALAQAAWDQSGWGDAIPAPAAPERVAGPEGGQAAEFPDHPIADTDEEQIYQSVRYNLSAYHLPVPNGPCAVTLKFCEPHYAVAGKRVFDVKLQGKTVITELDIFARVGQNRPLDFSFDNLAVTNGWLDLEFVPRVEFPSIAGLVVHGANGFSLKVNCGGPACRDYAADWPAASAPKVVFPPTDDFYRDWADHQFGPDTGPAAAKIFAGIDGHLPRPSDWVDGPGGLRPDARPWDQVRPEYGFVDEFARLRPDVRGPGNQERFDYWLNSFQYLRAMAQVNCLWAGFNRALESVKAETDPARRNAAARETLLPLRRQLVARVEEVYQHLLATVSNPGELGTVANWEQHLLPGLLTKPGEELAGLLGEPLPSDANLPTAYRGPTRVVVPTVRGAVNPGEALRLKILVLAEQPPKETAVFWRPLGRGQFTKAAVTHVARGVHTATVDPPRQGTEAIEYYVRVVPARGEPVYFPATAPGLNQSVVVLP
jgi:hypothetical protein